MLVMAVTVLLLEAGGDGLPGLVRDMTITDGHPQTTADADLRPVLSRRNLTVKLGARMRLVVEGGRRAGVEYYQAAVAALV